MSKLIRYSKLEFTYTKDELMECECNFCGCIFSDERLTCPKCNSEDIVICSCHEGCICDVCEHEFDIWEDCYTHISPITPTLDVYMICKDCYSELKED